MTKYVIFSFWIVLTYPLGIDLHLAGVTRIAADLNAPESALHMAFSVYLAGMVPAMLAAGWLADNLGRRPVALAGALIFAAASVAAGASSSVTFFLTARFIQGLGAGCCYVVTFALLRDVLPDAARAKVLSMLNGITCIVPVLAPAIGFAILLLFSWPVMFYFSAGYAFLSLIFCLFFIRETLPARPAVIPEERGHQDGESEGFLNAFFLTRLMVTCLGMAVILTYVNVAPLILMGGNDFTPGQFSVTMALLAVVSMTVSFSMPKIISRFDSTAILNAALGVFLLNALLLGAYLTVLPHLALLLTVFGLCGTGFSMLFGILMSQALSPYSRRSGVASSVLAISQLSTASAYIWIMGRAGVPSVLMLLIILMTTALAGAILLKCYPENRRSRRVCHE